MEKEEVKPTISDIIRKLINDEKMLDIPPEYEAVFKVMVKEERLPPDAEFEVFESIWQMKEGSYQTRWEVQDMISYLKYVHELSKEQAIVYLVDFKKIESIATCYELSGDLPF